MQQTISDKYHRVSGRGYVLAAIIASILLHAGVAVWWFKRPLQNFQIEGAQTVTVDLIALTAPASEPVPQIVQPQPSSPEPEPLRNDEMTEKHKVIKKKPPEKKLPTEPRLAQELPPAPPAPAEEPKSTPAPVAAARYDVDYLNNPKPLYPALSQRLGEEGLVLVRVQVSADGRVLAVELKESSGFARLDEAALKTVAKYRFTSIGHHSSALVPIKFNLKK